MKPWAPRTRDDDIRFALVALGLLVLAEGAIWMIFPSAAPSIITQTSQWWDK